MSLDYTRGLWTVTSWNRRAICGWADARRVYRGPDAAEAVRIFEGLARWKRRGIVQMVGPTGLVSTVCKPHDPAKPAWETRYAHPFEPLSRSPEDGHADGCERMDARVWLCSFGCPRLRAGDEGCYVGTGG